MDDNHKKIQELLLSSDWNNVLLGLNLISGRAEEHPGQELAISIWHLEELLASIVHQAVHLCTVVKDLGKRVEEDDSSYYENDLSGTRYRVEVGGWSCFIRMQTAYSSYAKIVVHYETISSFKFEFVTYISYFIPGRTQGNETHAVKLIQKVTDKEDVTVTFEGDYLYKHWYKLLLEPVFINMPKP